MPTIVRLIVLSFEPNRISHRWAESFGNTLYIDIHGLPVVISGFEFWRICSHYSFSRNRITLSSLRTVVLWHLFLFNWFQMSLYYLHKPGPGNKLSILLFIVLPITILTYVNYASMNPIQLLWLVYFMICCIFLLKTSLYILTDTVIPPTTLNQLI